MSEFAAKFAGGLHRVGARALGAWFAFLLAGCAQVAPPNGGPADDSVPRVLSTWPDSGAVLVPLADSIAIVFSEPMQKNSVEEQFRLAPEMGFRERRWQGATWIVRLERPFTAGETYVGFFGHGAEDRRRNRLASYAFAFSTGERLDDGQLAGRVIGQRYAAKEVRLWLWPFEAVPPDTSAGGFPPAPLRIGETDAQGKFELSYLPRARALRIAALFDRERDGRFDPLRDRWAIHPEPIVIADSSSGLSGLELYLADPDEPATLRGALVDSLCSRSDARKRLLRVRAIRDSLNFALQGFPALNGSDSLRIGFELLRLDSLTAVSDAESVYCASPLKTELRIVPSGELLRSATGPKFEWKDVPRGVYRLAAFRDLDRDGVADAEEPAGEYPFPIETRPLRTLEKLDLVLRRR